LPGMVLLSIHHLPTQPTRTPIHPSTHPTNINFHFPQLLSHFTSHPAFNSSMEMKHEIFNLLRQHQLKHLPLISDLLLRFNDPPFPDNISNHPNQSDLSIVQRVKFRRPGTCPREFPLTIRNGVAHSDNRSPRPGRRGANLCSRCRRMKHGKRVIQHTPLI
jgi:hypothetical protein